MATMHRIISISLSVLLVMLFCSWSTTKAYNVKPSHLSHYQENQAQSVSSSVATKNGHYRKYNPDYDDWLFYMHDVDEDGRETRRRIKRSSFYETISNFTRTSVYNLYNWGKSSFVSSSSLKINKDNNNDSNGEDNVIENVMPRVDNEVQEPPLPIPRVRFRKKIDYLPENRKHCKCTSSDRYGDISLNDVSEPFVFTDAFRRSHLTEDSLLPFFSHDPSKPDGPSKWDEAAPACGGSFQSPIALDDRKGIFSDRPLKIKGLESIPLSIQQQNDGHSVKYVPEYLDEEHPYISGGPLSSKYKLHHYHFHWGSNNNQGSEHTLNGRRYANEVHFVHYDSYYKSFDEAADKPRGLAVIGFFYEVNSQLQDSLLANGLDKVINWNDTNTLYDDVDEVYSIGDLIGKKPFDFIAYSGSLTTPPCYETVVWIVATKPLQAAQKELDAFRQLRDSKGSQMVDNFRPLQNRNGRTLYFFFDQ